MERKKERIEIAGSKKPLQQLHFKFFFLLQKISIVVFFFYCTKDTCEIEEITFGLKAFNSLSANKQKVYNVEEITITL